jgi:hypothetical protein
MTAGAEICPHCEKQPVVKGDAPEVFGLKPGRGFKFWFINIYWYHFRAHTVIAAVIAVIAAVSVYSVLSKEKYDFFFVIASAQPVIVEQGEMLAEFWEEKVPGINRISSSVLHMGEYSELAAVNAQMLMITLISEEHRLFIIGESMIGWYAESMELFMTAGEMGLPGGGPLPQLVPLHGAPVMEEYGFVFEPMFALVRRSEPGSGLSEPAIECLRVLLYA